MLKTTARLIDACWRAASYCLHPRVMALSLLPLALAGVGVWVLMQFFWEPAIDAVRSTMESWHLLDGLLHWMDRIGLEGLRSALPLVVLVALGVPVLLLSSLLLVAAFMTPAMVRLVAARRFPGLERKKGGGLLLSLAWAIGHTLLALLGLLLSIPFWFIPPLVLFIPPLIWGWLSYRVFAFDALAEHASRIERRRLISEHRLPLLGLGLMTGYLGAAPAAIWSFGVTSFVLAPYLVLVSLWLYTLVFAFSSLWFTHYCLQALHELRQARAAGDEIIDMPPQEEGGNAAAEGTGASPLLPPV